MYGMTVPQVLRFNWEKVDGKLIASRVHRRVPVEHGFYVISEHLVEFPDQVGKPVRVPIQIDAHRLDVPEIGGTVALLVNKKRTKAAFDLKDPRARFRRQRFEDEEAAQKARFDSLKESRE